MHLQHSVRVHVNLRAGLGGLNANATMPRCQGVTRMIGAQQSTIPMGHGQLPARIKPTLVTPITNNNRRKETKREEWEANRAATCCGRVRLKHHIDVHLQHSARVHVNLRAGLGRLNKNSKMPR